MMTVPTAHLGIENVPCGFSQKAIIHSLPIPDIILVMTTNFLSKPLAIVKCLLPLMFKRKGNMISIRINKILDT